MNKPNRNSRNAQLAALKIGYTIWTETTLHDYAQDMRLPAKCRRPLSMQAMVFAAALYTAMGSNPAEIRYLICITRRV